MSVRRYRACMGVWMGMGGYGYVGEGGYECETDTPSKIDIWRDVLKNMLLSYCIWYYHIHTGILAPQAVSYEVQTTTGGCWGTHSPEHYYCRRRRHYINNYNDFHTNESPWLGPAGIPCCRHAPKSLPTQRSHRKRRRHIPGHAHTSVDVTTSTLVSPRCKLWGMGCKSPQRTLSHSPATSKTLTSTTNPLPQGLPKHAKLTQNSVKITRKKHTP